MAVFVVRSIASAVAIGIVARTFGANSASDYVAITVAMIVMGVTYAATERYL